MDTVAFVSDTRSFSTLFPTIVGGCVFHISLSTQFRYKDTASRIIFYKLRLLHFLELSTGPIRVANNFR